MQNAALAGHQNPQQKIHLMSEYQHELKGMREVRLDGWAGAEGNVRGAFGLLGGGWRECERCVSTAGWGLK